MAHGVGEMLTPATSPTSGAKQPQHHFANGNAQQQQQQQQRKSVGVMGSRRIFAPTFKLKVLNSYRNDLDCRGNQRATARKYNIHRRQIQKWLQCEASLRNCAASAAADRRSPSPDSTHLPPPQQPAVTAATLNPSRARLHGDEQQQQQQPPPPPPQQQQQAQPSAVAATGYRFPPLPQHYDYPQQQQQQHLVYPTQQQQTQVTVQYPFAAGFQPPVVRYLHDEQPAIVKRERASPDDDDSAAAAMHRLLLLKRERLEAECCGASFSSGVSDSGASSGVGSPVPPHLESLPPSPRDSSSCSDSDSADRPGNASAAAAAADLARRRSFSLRFKLRVLDAFHADKLCRKNQRATARKFNINRRQVQKWLSQERDLRDPTQHRGANRQRLGSHSPVVVAAAAAAASYAEVKRERLPSPHEETPVDLRTGGLEYGTYCELSPNGYVDTALTPPYSQPGCTLSCCSQEQPTTTTTTYYCYSPPQPQQQQEQPLCLVKPKAEPVSSTVPSPPAAPTTPPKRDAILFKPYLDNPVSKPAPPSPSNNNSHEACNLNDLALDVSFRPHYAQQQQQQQPFHHLEIPQARSAFVRYPAYL